MVISERARQRLPDHAVHRDRDVQHVLLPHPVHAERQARRLLRGCTIEQLIYSKIQATAGQDDRAWKRRTLALIESNPGK